MKKKGMEVAATKVKKITTINLLNNLSSQNE